MGLLVIGAESAAASPSRVPAWKTLINEASAGRIDTPFTCTTAREAARHFPVNSWLVATPTHQIVQAYERRVCSSNRKPGSHTS